MISRCKVRLFLTLALWYWSWMIILMIIWYYIILSMISYFFILITNISVDGHINSVLLVILLLITLILWHWIYTFLLIISFNDLTYFVMPIIHICCYWGRGNLREWWANTFSSEGHIFILAIIVGWKQSSPLYHCLSDLTDVIIILVVISITIAIISVIVIPSVCWTKVMFLLLLIFRFNWEI